MPKFDDVGLKTFESLMAAIEGARHDGVVVMRFAENLTPIQRGKAIEIMEKLLQDLRLGYVKIQVID